MNVKFDPKEALQNLNLTLSFSRFDKVVLMLPSIECIQAAIKAGPDATVTLVVAHDKRIKNVSLDVKGGKVVIREEMPIETLTLSQLSDLNISEDGWFSFKGAVVTVDPEKIGSLGRYRSYRHDHYKVTINGENGTHSYENGGSGYGTVHDDEIIDVRH